MLVCKRSQSETREYTTASPETATLSNTHIHTQNNSHKFRRLWEKEYKRIVYPAHTRYISSPPITTPTITTVLSSKDTVYAKLWAASAVSKTLVCIITTTQPMGITVSSKKKFMFCIYFIGAFVCCMSCVSHQFMYADYCNYLYSNWY